MVSFSKLLALTATLSAVATGSAVETVIDKVDKAGESLSKFKWEPVGLRSLDGLRYHQDDFDKMLGMGMEIKEAAKLTLKPLMYKPKKPQKIDDDDIPDDAIEQDEDYDVTQEDDYPEDDEEEMLAEMAKTYMTPEGIQKMIDRYRGKSIDIIEEPSETGTPAFVSTLKHSLEFAAVCAIFPEGEDCERSTDRAVGELSKLAELFDDFRKSKETEEETGEESGEKNEFTEKVDEMMGAFTNKAGGKKGQKKGQPAEETEPSLFDLAEEAMADEPMFDDDLDDFYEGEDIFEEDGLGKDEI